MEEVFGHIERITFQNPDNGYTIARLQEKGKPELTTIVGTLPTVQVGETVRCQGAWKNDRQFGFQFAVSVYQVERPSSETGLKKYLGSGLIKGIGPVFAERIVDYLGAKTLETIDGNPESLLEVEGIGGVRLQRIKQHWEEQKAVRELMIFLQGYGISPTYALKVYKTYGEESMRIITENPYQLARDIWGIGFKTADQTARKLGMAPDAEIRIDAGISYVLYELSNDGHTCYPVEEFLEKARELLEVDANLVAQRLEASVKSETVFIGPLEVDGATKPYIWLQLFQVSEVGIGRETGRISASPAAFDVPDAERSLDWAQKTLNLVLAPAQRAAVISGLGHKIHIITGGPGTGKSTITKVLLFLAHQHTHKILLAAPTGRAAKRMSEITQMAASTIHSLLEFDFSINGFRKNRDNPLHCELLIVDEASMIDTVLMYNLLKALPSEARLVLVGDVDQLPSVGAGAVLTDMIQSGRTPVSRLTEIYRQGAGSQIIANAHRVNKGEWLDTTNRKEGDFFFIEAEDTQEIADTILDLAHTRLPKAYRFAPIDDIQVLCPMNRGDIGARRMNELLQRRLNPSTQPLVKLGRVFHLHDKVMQVRNNYDKNVFNGDIGRIRRIDNVEHEVVIAFDQREVVYDFSDLDQVALAYAVTVHKYQGSECPCVILPLHTTHYPMLYRNLLYTGITRGKKMVILVGSKKALAMAIRNDQPVKRYTGLGAVLKG